MIIRRARMADATGIAKVHVDSWRKTYKDIVPKNILKNMTYEKKKRLWESVLLEGCVFVAEDEEGRIIGFATGGEERSGAYEDFQGELSTLYIVEDYQSRELGERLVKTVIEEIETLGFNSMVVSVLEENETTRFYEALGGQMIDTVEVDIGGKKLKEFVYGWKDLSSIYEKIG
ncbi:MAG: GNAT family N-acetyltransferase [Lysinibacillus sp.]